MTTKHHPVAPPDRAPSSGPARAIFGVLAVIAIAVMVYVVSGPPERSVAHNNAVAAKTPTATPKLRPEEKALSPKPEPPAVPKPSPETQPPPKPPEREVPQWKPPAPKTEDPAVASSNPLAVPAFPEDDAPKQEPPEPRPAEPSANDVAATTSAAPANPPPPVEKPKAPTPPAASTTLPVPDKALITAKTKEVRALFKSDFASRDPAARATLAERLARSALETSDDPAGAYVLATEARDQAIQSGDFETFTTLGRFLTERFGVETYDEDILAFGKLQNMSGKPAEWYQRLFEEISRRVDDATARDDFDRAGKYAGVARATAAKANDTATAQQWAARSKDLATLKTQFGSYKAAEEVLRTSPDDASAHTKWGTYLCLLKGNFSGGLPHLQRGSDAALAALAKRDSNPNRNTAETIAIADEWWNLGEKNKSFRTHGRRHAAEMYREALPQVSGLVVAKIEKRLKELDAETGGRPTGGNPVENLLTSSPWLVRWERVNDRGDRVPGNGNGNGDGNGNDHPDEETITFSEGGQLDSRFFVSYEIKSDYIELNGRNEDRDGPIPWERRRHARAILVGTELRFIAYRGGRLERPDFRGIAVRKPAE